MHTCSYQCIVGQLGLHIDHCCTRPHAHCLRHDRYDTFINWELWWPGFPVLVYFKESQTKPEGQIHFFPVIFDGKQLYDVMVERCPKALPK